jgi:hypothetical protein
MMKEDPEVDRPRQWREGIALVADILIVLSEEAWIYGERSNGYPA